MNNLKPNTSLQIGNVIVSIGIETHFVALISPQTNKFIKLDRTKTNRTLKRVKRELKTWLNSDETFTFEFMTPELTNKLIDILKGKKPNKKQDKTIEVLEELQSELNTLASDWEETHNAQDANWVGVKLPNKMWRIAKKLGLRKDGYYGYLLFSKSVNSCGSDFAYEIQQICAKYDAPTYTSEYQL